MKSQIEQMIDLGSISQEDILVKPYTISQNSLSVSIPCLCKIGVLNPADLVSVATLYGSAAICSVCGLEYRFFSTASLATNFTSVIKQNFSEAVAQLNSVRTTKPSCDCGALKANTTHSSWCSDK